MNKYQEALDDIKSRQYQDDWDNLCNVFDEDDEAISTIQKLLDKATPKKLNMENMHYICCPNCHSDEVEFYDHDHNVVKLNYCNRCGQALDWSENE